VVVKIRLGNEMPYLLVGKPSRLAIPEVYLCTNRNKNSKCVLKVALTGGDPKTCFFIAQ
jgi:hypothetical protein